jgi:hypothetical protein
MPHLLQYKLYNTPSEQQQREMQDPREQQVDHIIPLITIYKGFIKHYCFENFQEALTEENLGQGHVRPNLGQGHPSKTPNTPPRKGPHVEA